MQVKGCFMGEQGSSDLHETNIRNESSDSAIKTSVAAIWSLICGIVGLIVFLFAIPSIILCIVGLVQIKKSAGRLRGLSLAITGLCLSAFSIILWAIIFAIILPSVIHRLSSAKQTMTNREIAEIAQSLKAYAFAVGSYPTSQQGLEELLIDKQGGPYLKQLNNDPWGRSFHYRFPGTRNTDSYDLWSNGEDGIEGTADDITDDR
jgi:general secretion pathway protein G